MYSNNHFILKKSLNRYERFLTRRKIICHSVLSDFSTTGMHHLDTSPVLHDRELLTNISLEWMWDLQLLVLERKAEDNSSQLSFHQPLLKCSCSPLFPLILHNELEAIIKKIFSKWFFSFVNFGSSFWWKWDYRF